MESRVEFGDTLPGEGYWQGMKGKTDGEGVRYTNGEGMKKAGFGIIMVNTYLVIITHLVFPSDTLGSLEAKTCPCPVCPSVANSARKRLIAGKINEYNASFIIRVPAR